MARRGPLRSGECGARHATKPFCSLAPTCSPCSHTCSVCQRSRSVLTPRRQGGAQAPASVRMPTTLSHLPSTLSPTPYTPHPTHERRTGKQEGTKPPASGRPPAAPPLAPPPSSLPHIAPALCVSTSALSVSPSAHPCATAAAVAAGQTPCRAAPSPSSLPSPPSRAGGVAAASRAHALSWRALHPPGSWAGCWWGKEAAGSLLDAHDELTSSLL